MRTASTKWRRLICLPNPLELSWISTSPKRRLFLLSPVPESVSEVTVPKKKGLTFGVNFKNKSTYGQRPILPTQTKVMPTQALPTKHQLPTKETSTPVRQPELIQNTPQLKNSIHQPSNYHLPTQKIAETKGPVTQYHVEPELIQKSHHRDMDECTKPEQNEFTIFKRSDSLATIRPDAIEAVEFPKSSLLTDEEVLKLIRDYFNSPIDNKKIGPTLKLRQDLAFMFIESCVKPE